MIELGNNIETYLIIGIFSAVILGLLGWGIKGMITDRKRNKELLDKLDDYAKEQDLDEISAQVLSKNCGIKVYGTKTPDCCKEFSVTFLTTYGEEVQYKVLEEVYLSLEEGQNGTLATINGNFYGFYVEEE